MGQARERPWRERVSDGMNKGVISERQRWGTLKRLTRSDLQNLVMSLTEREAGRY
jgi:hypothetical protein